jgi:hypothetical protein
MKNIGLALALAAAVAIPAVAQTDSGQGQAVVTVLPRHDGEVAPSVAGQDMSVKVNGKLGRVTGWTPADHAPGNLELVVLIDDSARSSLGSQLASIAHFIQTLPPAAQVAVAYMENGRAVFAHPLAADHALAIGALHIPGGSPGSDASPYFCLSDLATHWPSRDAAARREVVMVTDGVDTYQPHFDPDDPYVQSAIADSVRAHLVVYSIYWENRGRLDQSAYENNAGQNLLSEVTQATGGKSFWMGMGNPVSIEPYLDELTRRLHNQYELGFTARLDGKPKVETLKLNLSAPGSEVDAPQQVYVAPGAPAQN